MSQDRLYSVLLAPIVSEKSTMIGEKNEQVAFRVKHDATKPEVKAAVELLFKVQVESVQILNTVLDPADGFAFDSYWSSTETNQFNGVSLHFNLGYMNPNTKDNAFRVRAVRRF